MKNIAKFNILITTFTLIFSRESLAQYEKKQIVQDSKINLDKKIENYSEEAPKNNGKYYLGIDAYYQNSALGGSTKNPYDYYEEQTSMAGVFAGYDNQDFYKIESVYSKTNEKNQIVRSDNFSSFDLRTRTVGVDFKPYLIFDKKTQASFYLIFGLNYNKIETEEVNQTKIYSWNGATTKITSHNSSVNKVSPTFGLGVEYLFYKNFALRFQYKRNFVDAKIKNSEVLNKIKLIDTLGVGISHAF